MPALLRRWRRPRRCRRPGGRGSPPVVVAAAFTAGSVPFANYAARRTEGVDLRDVDGGTVSGSGLYRVAGFGPLAAAGIFEVAKGALGPLLAGPERPALAALAGGAAVAGHNWSPFLGGSGGRGISPAMGALLVTCWPGALVLGAGMGLGRLAGETALGSFVSFLVLVPIAARTHGGAGARAAAAVLAPLLAKRLLGNGRPDQPSLALYGRRLIFDRDDASAGRERASHDQMGADSMGSRS